MKSGCMSRLEIKVSNDNPDSLHKHNIIVYVIWNIGGVRIFMLRYFNETQASGEVGEAILWLTCFYSFWARSLHVKNREKYIF